MNKFNLNARLQYHEKLDSTNNYALKLLKESQPEEGTVIMADFQTLGKGQRNNRWESEKKRNITLSIILYPEFLEAEKQFYLSMAISLGLVSFLNNYHLDVTIKWPNDIYIQRKKIAGLLIENSMVKRNLMNSVSGIGLNVNQERFSKEIPNPTSMYLELKKTFDLKEVQKSLLNSVEDWLVKLYLKEYQIIKQSYEQKMLFRNEWSDFLLGNVRFSGKITGVNEYGQLIITDDKSAVRTFNFKEVEYCL